MYKIEKTKICNICPRHCAMPLNGVGFCHARKNIEGEIKSINYCLLTAINLDPIEKKPLKNFHFGSNILSVGSFGCNLSCSFCQNSSISMSDGMTLKTEYVSPRDLVELAIKLRRKGNIGIAFTYNEPTIGYEYVMEVSKLAKSLDLKTVMVTNGYISEDILVPLLPFVDAWNIDLKSFNNEFYKKIDGDLDVVKNTIKLANEKCHVEVTTLIIPDENDTDEEMEALSSWLASVNKNIPLHVSRFFPRYMYNEKPPTPIAAIHRLSGIARNNLKFVYEGNV